MDFVNQIKNRGLEWKQEKLAEILELKASRELASQNLQEELKKEMKIGLAKINAVGSTEVAMSEDYKQFLDEIDQLKERIQKAYPQMPSSMGLTISRHAKRLLNSMYDAKGTEDVKKRVLQEQKFIGFLEAVYKDTTLISSNTDSNKTALPSETISLI